MSPEPDEVREDDWEDEPDEGTRSIFAAGWFRAVLVLTVLAIVVVVALPYLLNWFDPLPPRTNVVSPLPPKSDAPSAVSPSAPPAVEVVPQKTPPPAAPPSSGASLPPSPPRSAPSAAGSSPAAALAKPALPPRTVSAAPAPSRPAAATQGTREQTPGGYWVQLGLFKDPKNAEALARKLRDEGFAVHVARVTRNAPGAGLSVPPPGAYHLVRAGGFRDEAHAIAARDALREKGYAAAFLTQGAAR